MHRKANLAEATGLLPGTSQQAANKQSLIMRIFIIISWVALALGSGFVLFLAISKSIQEQKAETGGKVSVKVRGDVAAKAPYTVSQLKSAAAAIDPELMVHGPSRSLTGYNNTFKSPCWSDVNGRLQCLPHLILLGGFHSGTGYLIHGLKKHADIATDVSSNNQFWAEDGKSMVQYLEGWQNAVKRAAAAPEKTVIMEHSQSSFAFYWAAGGKTHRTFGKAMKPCWENCTKHAAGKTDECMEALCFPLAQKADRQHAERAHISYVEDQHMPLVMRAVFAPRIPRLVAFIRDPVDRMHSAFYAYSHYHGRYGGPTPQGFLGFVKESLATFHNCSKKHGVKECVLLFESLGMEEEKVFYHCDQLLRGTYSVYVEIWLRFFPRESILFLKSEDVFRDGPAALRVILAHAGLPDPGLAQAKAMMADYQIPRHVKGRQMLPEARKLLMDFYLPFNKRLADLTGDPGFNDYNILRTAPPANTTSTTATTTTAAMTTTAATAGAGVGAVSKAAVPAAASVAAGPVNGTKSTPTSKP